MTLVIRSADKRDAPTIMRFVRELADYVGAPDAVRMTEPDLAAALFAARPAAEAVIAEWQGAPAGFALFFHSFSTWTGTRGLYLEDLYVTSAARGRQIGGALLAHVAAIARERGCTRFEWGVLDWNGRTIDFYRRAGARIIQGSRVMRVEGAALANLAARRANA